MTGPWWGNTPEEQWRLEESGQMYWQNELSDKLEEINEMVKFGDYGKQSNYLSAADVVNACRAKQVSPLQFERQMVIQVVRPETFQQRDNPSQTEEKLVCYFQNVDKGLVLNKGNCCVLGELCGGDTDNAPGVSVVLFLVAESYGDTGYGIRLRAGQGQAPQPPVVTPPLPPAGEAPPDDEIPF